MHKVTVRELKRRLQDYLRKVRAGQPLVIYEGRVPVACIVPIEAAQSPSDSDRLNLLVAHGVISRPRRLPSAAKLRAGLLKSRGDAPALSRTVMEDREADR